MCWSLSRHKGTNIHKATQRKPFVDLRGLVSLWRDSLNKLWHHYEIWRFEGRGRKNSVLFEGPLQLKLDRTAHLGSGQTIKSPG